MTVETQAPVREKTRVFITGHCEGLSELTDALGRHGEVELVGRSDQVDEAPARLPEAPPGCPPCHAQLGAYSRRTTRRHPRVHPGADRPPRLW